MVLPSSAIPLLPTPPTIKKNTHKIPWFWHVMFEEATCRTNHPFIHRYQYPWLLSIISHYSWLLMFHYNKNIPLYLNTIIEGSLEVKLPTIWTDEKQRWEESEKRREEKRREERRSKRERVRRKKIQVCEKVGKSRNTMFFQWFVAPEGRQVGSLKRRVRASWPNEKWKIARRCGAKHISKSKCTKHLSSGALLEVEMSKSARRCGAKHLSKSKFTKHLTFGTLLEVDMSKKCTPLWREAHFEVNSVKKLTGSEHFWKLRCRKNARRCGAKHISKSKVQKTEGFGPLLDVQMLFRVAGCKGLSTLSKVSKTWGFCSISKNSGRRGTFEEDLQRCIFRGRRSTRDMFLGNVGRSGRWFPERGWILEHQIFRFAEMLLRDRCSTSYDLASLFRGRHSTLERWTGKIAKRIGTRPSALHSTFHFGRTSRRIASFFMLST